MAEIDHERVKHLEVRLDSLLDFAQAAQQRSEALEERLSRTEKTLLETLEALKTANETSQYKLSHDAIKSEVNARFDVGKTALDARLEAIRQRLAQLPTVVYYLGSEEKIAAYRTAIDDFDKNVKSALESLQDYVETTLVHEHLAPDIETLENRRDEILELAETSAERTATTFKELADTLDTAAQDFASDQGDWGARLGDSWENRAVELRGHVSQRLNDVLTRGQEVVDNTIKMIERVQQTADDVGSIRKTTSRAMDESGGALTVITDIIDEIGGMLSDVK